MSYPFRIAAVAALIASALSAHALTFAFQTEGSTTAGNGTDYAESVGGLISGNEAGAVYREDHTPGLTVTSLVYSLQETTPGLVFNSIITSGSGTVKGLSPDLFAYTLNFTVSGGDVVTGSVADDTRAFAGSIVTFVISAPGSYIDGLIGNGTFGGTFKASVLGGGPDIYNGISKTSLDLKAVPEPAPFALFAIGLVGLAARRRK